MAMTAGRSAQERLLIVGGGMAGLGAALACAQARPDVPITLLEQAPEFSEVGAGIQLGPNAVRVLRDWGLEPALAAVAAFPATLQVRRAADGAGLATLPLGEQARRAYGAPYVTIHRADLHTLLLQALRPHGQVALYTGQRVQTLHSDAHGVLATGSDEQTWSAQAALLADGVWSVLRQQVVGDGPPRFSGHLAYRGLLPMDEAPPSVARDAVVAWLGPRLHGVHYPVRAGRWLNVVLVVEGPLPDGDVTGWDHAAQRHALQQALGPVHPALAALVEAVPHWRLWPLFGRAPMRSAHEHAQGRVGLLGDAAHPMRPYLAQGAAMALEDAWTLAQLLPPARQPIDWPAVLAAWARVRWPRNARVQARSRANGVIFHATGALRLGRDAALALLGPRLLDQPWLYSGPPRPTAWPCQEGR
ncbi:FAD-dependent monooxygenase [Tepidimonas aquatica]|nr:FAD-dependent monooxygenase [Tepidimonas aquatica]